MLFGIGFLAVITAAITSTFVARNPQRAAGLGAEAPTAEQVRELDRRLERIEAALATDAPTAEQIRDSTGGRTDRSRSGWSLVIDSGSPTRPAVPQDRHEARPNTTWRSLSRCGLWSGTAVSRRPFSPEASPIGSSCGCCHSA